MLKGMIRVAQSGMCSWWTWGAQGIAAVMGTAFRFQSDPNLLFELEASQGTPPPHHQRQRKSTPCKTSQHWRNKPLSTLPGNDFRAQFFFPGNLPSSSQRKKAEIPKQSHCQFLTKDCPDPRNIFSPRSLQSSSKQRKKRENTANPSKPPSQF